MSYLKVTGTLGLWNILVVRQTTWWLFAGRRGGWSSDIMVGYVKPAVREKLDTMIIHVGTNDLTKGVNTMRKVRKCVEVTRGLDTTLMVENTEHIEIRFSGIIERTYKDFGNKIKETNIRLENYCLGKSLIFVDNSSINK